MYDRIAAPRVSRRHVDPLPGRDPVEAGRLALERVRKTLSAYRPGVPFNPEALRTTIAGAPLPPEREAERLFALGWLHWVAGDYADAETLLMQAVECSRQTNATVQLTEATYWLARVRLRLERPDALGEFEALLRQLAGSPQATAWFVDLLWRAGHIDRAEQVWKSVRGNKRVLGCPEGPLLEARSLLRGRAVSGAIKILVEAQPTNGVVWVERLLLLSWAALNQNRRDKALEFLRRIEELPYPPAALAIWRHAIEEHVPAPAVEQKKIVPVVRPAVPPGVPVAAWFLHQAARAVIREDYVEALACVRLAQKSDPDWATVPDAAIVRAALPELERRGLAQYLAVALRPQNTEPTIPAHLLTDLVDLLRQHSEGPAILEAAIRGDADAVRAALAPLATRPDLPPRLLHHLAVLELRSAQALDDKDETAAAEPHWRAAWTAWFRFFVEPTAARPVFDWLLTDQRRRINDFLARNAVTAARRHWLLVLELPSLAARQSTALAADLSERVERFRDELASEYLVATREAMRYGAVPEGWHADYDKGLSHLRRLLSLDRDNVRLLTALVEICGDWFLDLYNAADHTRLTEQVTRFALFAQRLLRLTENRPGDLAARAALSQYFKFRGFIAADRAEKVKMYRESLRLNSANENVRELLQGLGEA